VSKLLFYAMTSPAKLKKIGEYIEKRVRKDLAKRRYGYVEVSVRALNELIKACHKDLNLFAGHAVAIMKLLFTQESKSDLQVLAAEAFARFAEFQDDAAHYDLEQFVEYLLRLACQEEPRVRLAGLRALDLYITRTADLEPLLIKYVDAPQSRLLACLLEARAAEAAAVREQAEVCLKALGSRANHLTARSLLAAMFAFLDQRALWADAQALEALRALCFSIPPQHDPITVARFLQHADARPRLEDRAEVLRALTGVVRGNAGPIGEVLAGLLRHAAPLHEDENADEQREEPAGREQVREAALACVAALARRTTDPARRMDGIAYALERLAPRARPGPHRALLRAALAFAEALPQPLHSSQDPRPLPLELPRALFDRLLAALLALEPSNRPLAHTLLDQLLRSTAFAVPALAPDAVLAASSPAATTTVAAGGRQRGCVSREELRRGEAGQRLRLTLYQHVLLADNLPDSYAALAGTFRLLLDELQWDELGASGPLVLELQKRLQQEAPKHGAEWARRGHALLAAWAAAASRSLHLPPLEEYVRGLLRRRKAAKQVPASLKWNWREERLVVLEPPAADVGAGEAVLSEDLLLERSQLVEAALREARLPEAAAEELRAALAQRFRHKQARLPSEPRLPGPAAGLFTGGMQSLAASLAAGARSDAPLAHGQKIRKLSVRSVLSGIEPSPRPRSELRAVDFKVGATPRMPAAGPPPREPFERLAARPPPLQLSPEVRRLLTAPPSADPHASPAPYASPQLAPLDLTQLSPHCTLNLHFPQTLLLQA
jgi:hypothetical protein